MFFLSDQLKQRDLCISMHIEKEKKHARHTHIQTYTQYIITHGKKNYTSSNAHACTHMYIKYDRYITHSHARTHWLRTHAHKHRLTNLHAYIHTNIQNKSRIHARAYQLLRRVIDSAVTPRSPPSTR